MLTGRPTHDERGFTVIEMIIVMVIAGVLLLMMGGLLTRSFSSGEKSTQERKAVEQVGTLMARFNDDLRLLGSPQRDAAVVNDPIQLENALLRDEGLIDGTGSIKIDVRDIVEATGSSLAFRANVHANSAAGVDECVRYIATQVAPRQMIREVWTQANVAPAVGCGGTRLERTVMIERLR